MDTTLRLVRTSKRATPAEAGTAPEGDHIGESSMRIRVNDSVHLSDIRIEDKESNIRYLNDESVSRYMFLPYPYTDADAEWWVKRVAQQQQEVGKVVSFAVRQNRNGEQIGTIGFNDYSNDTHKAEIGYSGLAHLSIGRA